MSGLQSRKTGLCARLGRIAADWRTAALTEAGRLMTVSVAALLLLAGGPVSAQVRSAGSGPARSGLDSLGRLLDEYTKALVSYGAAFKNGECDAIIASCHDSLTRNYTARYLFRHYNDSPLMGDETVAIHLYDRWFSESGKTTAGNESGPEVRFESEDEAFSAKVFADANRQSLLGMPAPPLRLQDRDGNDVLLFGGASGKTSGAAAGADSGATADRRLKVLYFYATDCAVCKLYSRQLQTLLPRCGQKIDLITVYTGRERETWEQYVRERLSWETADVRHFNLWDADSNGDFVTRYGVLSTPRLFLIDESGTIIGRRLDPEALRMLLEVVEQDNHYAYGGKESRQLFEGLLPVDDLSIPAVTETMDLIRRISWEKGNPAMERHMAGDLLYYLNSHDDETSIEVCDWFIREYILSGKMDWKSANDSLSVVHLASFLQELRSKAAPGSPLPAVNAYVEEIAPAATSATRTGLKGKFRLDRLKKRCRLKKREMVLIFYDPACSECKDQIAKAQALATGAGRSADDAGTPAGKAKDDTPAVILINVEDNLERLSEKEQDALLEAFDLSTLPHLIRTDAGGRITRRYFKL